MKKLGRPKRSPLVIAILGMRIMVKEEAYILYDKVSEEPRLSEDVKSDFVSDEEPTCYSTRNQYECEYSLNDDSNSGVPADDYLDSHCVTECRDYEDGVYAHGGDGYTGYGDTPN